MKAVILAAGMGTRLEPVSSGHPKCMVPVAGVPLIDRLLDRLAQAAVEQVIVVTGYAAESLREHVAASGHALLPSVTFVHNDRYADWGNFYSLLVAEDAVGGDSFVRLDGDVLIDDTVLPTVLSAAGPVALAVDCRPGLGAEEMKVRVDEDGRIIELNKRVHPTAAIGEFAGIERVDSEMVPAVFAQLRQLIELGETHEYYERAYELLAQDRAPIRYADIGGSMWTEIDDAADLATAHHLAQAMDRPDRRRVAASAK